jgi:glycosyltransferase involved in cell wall biosynthesis
MATYNGARFIKEQIDSILIQLKANDELIISDDRSTDSTIQIIKSYNDPRIKLFIHERPGGPTENFSNALEKATGDFIFLADQDDVWLEQKYEKMLKLLKAYDLVLSDSIVVDEDKKVLRPSFYAMHGSAPGILKNVAKSSYFGSCMAFRRDILHYSLPFPPTKEIGHDLWLGLLAELTGKVYFSREALILYRRHASTVTSVGIGKSRRSLLTKLAGRITIFKYLIKFYIKYLINGKRFSINNNAHV